MPVNIIYKYLQVFHYSIHFFFQQNETDREHRLKKINEKIAASQAAKKPGKKTVVKSNY